jgi:phospho-N-acetylmuramoyl-pentapeptide-transferase
MGGIIIILSIIIPTLLFADLTNLNTILLLFTTISLGLLGFMDDYVKVFKHNKEGISGRYKIVGQVGIGFIVAIALLFSPQLGLNQTSYSTNLGLEQETISVAASDNIKTTIPFFKNNEFDYKSLSPFDGTLDEYTTWIVYILMVIFIVTACSNGANLTDGMDGLNAGVSAIVGVTLGIFAYLGGNTIQADYLNIMYIPNSGEIFVFIAAFVGALMGFLWYNSFPAQVFMGDTGSLTIGGIIGVCAVLIRKELMLPIFCGVFLCESLSVIIQRLYFKYTKKRYGAGRRVFKMAPIHHHFQKEGIDAIIKKPQRAIPESKIVIRFWIISILLAVLSIVTLKIR